MDATYRFDEPSGAFRMILATGGSGMVQSGVQRRQACAGRRPRQRALLHQQECGYLERACTDLIISKTFDNGMICASEQAVIVDKEIKDQFEKIMTRKQLLFPQSRGNAAGDQICDQSG